MTWKSLPWIAFDTETTGLDPNNDRITEFGVVHLHEGVITLRWNTRINPEIPIPDIVVEKIGITNEEAAIAPPFKWIAKSIKRMLQGGVLVAFNAPFDIDFLVNEFSRAGVAPPPGLDHQNVLDPLTFVREIHKYESGGKSLDKTCKRLGIEIENWHHAVDDAQAVALVLYNIADGLNDDIDALLEGQKELRSNQKQSRESYAKRKTEVPPELKKYIGRDTNGWIIDFGKYKGVHISKLVTTNPGYFDWITREDFPQELKDFLKTEVEAVMKEFGIEDGG